MMSSNISVIIVEKSGSLKSLCVKNYDETQLYKRCGFKSDNNFQKRCEWRIVKDSKKYIITAYGKDVGRVGLENNYKFPAPINNISLFGNCVLVLCVDNKNNVEGGSVESMSIDFWENINPTLVTGSSKFGNICHETHKEKTTSDNDTASTTNEKSNNTLNDNEESNISYNESDMSELVEEEYLPE
jgi:hypothetical protein